MSKKVTVRNNEYGKLDELNEETYWKELGLNIELIKETKFNNLNSYFDADIRKQKKSVLLEISSFLLYEEEQTESADELLGTEVSDHKKKLYLLIKEFTFRKKMTIQEYVQQANFQLDYLSEVALVWSLYEQSPSHLFEILTYHNWRSRASNTLFTYSNKQDKEKILKIATDSSNRDDLCNRLYKKSGQANEYKIYSYAKFSDLVIFQLYKMINDKTVPDFEEPIRNREVKSIMFAVNTVDSTLEIRDYTLRERDALLDFLASMFGAHLNEVATDPYIDYDAAVLKKSILGIEQVRPSTDGIVISAITFSKSTLPKSPLIHFELNDSDVMEAVFQAHQSGVIDLSDLKDIKSLKLQSAKTSRTIRAIALESGDVLFSLDDSGLDSETKKHLRERFEKRFSIPLDQPISNLHFNGDIEEKVDYLMGLTKEEPLDDLTKGTFEDLLKKKVMVRKEHIEKFCTVCWEIYESEEECPECEVGLKSRKNITLEMDKDKAVKVFERKIRGFLGSPWSNTKDGRQTIDKEVYQFLIVEDEDTGDEIRFLVTDQQLPLKVINKINRMVMPTAIVYIGSNKVNVEKYNDSFIITKNYGFFYTMDKTEEFQTYMKEISSEFLRRQKQSSAKSAFEAYKSLGIIENNDKYTANDLEHDVYAIINDLTHNSTQWGSKFSGKILPEGVFTLSYKTKSKEKKCAYTYDCKLSRLATGYDLNIAEQRKAEDYITRAYGSDFLENYLRSDLEITAHLIISNNVDVKKIEAMNSYLKTKRINARAKLIKTEVLIKIYELYLLNFQSISSRPNYFKKSLISLFDTNADELLLSEVTTEFKKLLKDGLIEQATLDMEAFTDEMLQSMEMERISG
ncbi:hypothetical protein [Sporosarcina sp. SAFN-015]|uniref:hypothetical protein n=1 Tax=Sporosarcina sp. SAFN-015 TaxID=3387274 RepID=UPI003F7E175D